MELKADTSQTERGFAYWAISSGRDTAAITLFLLFPIGQILGTRVAPAVIGFCLLCLVLPHLATGRIHLLWQPLRRLAVACWAGGPTRWFLILYLSFIGWIALSLLWSPLPLDGLDDVFVLSAGLLLVPLLGIEGGRVAIFRFDIMLKVGLLLGSIAMLLDLHLITQFYSMFSERSRLFDLNRSAIFLAGAGWGLLLFPARNGLDRLFTWMTIGAIGAVAFSSESQSAQLAFLVTVIAFPVVRFSSRLRSLIFVGMAAVVVAFPLVVGPLAAAAGGEDPLVKPPRSAEHRIHIWSGYVALIGEKPIFGWGAKADQQLGNSGQGAVVAAKAGFPDRTSSPHNLALEIWVNFGLIGTLLFAGALVSIGMVIGAMPDRQAVGMTLMAITGFTATMFHSSAFQGWLVASLAIIFSIYFAAKTIAEEGRAAHNGLGEAG